MHTDGRLFLSRRARDPHNIWYVLAHELAHWVLDHRGQVVRQELDANAEAIKILSIGDPIWTERRAVRYVINLLCRLRLPAVGGHPPWEMEVADLLLRFPQRDAKAFIEALDLGVSWPPEAGWIERVVGTEISAEAAAAFVDRD
jgi:hypothetical protein